MAQSLTLHVASPITVPPAKLRRSVWPWLSVPLLGFLTLPLFALLLRASPEKLFVNLSEPVVAQAIALSLGTTFMATAITLVFGTPVAYLLARRRFRLRRAIDTLIDLPTVLPPLVSGLALLMAFGRYGVFGGLFERLGIQLAFTQAAVVMAQVFVAAPFYIKAATVGFASVSHELEQAAALDGAGDWQAFRHVTIPLAWNGLLSGAVMTWARALGEFGATIMFAGNFPGRTQTMPLAIYLGFEIDLDIALTLSVILVGCSFLVLMIVKSLLSRQSSEMGEY